MKEWLLRNLSSDQTFGEQFIGYIIVGTVFYIAIGISWWLLFLIANFFLKAWQWVNKKLGSYDYDVAEKFYNIEYYLDHIYDKFNVFKLKSRFKERFSERRKLKFTLALGLFWGVVAVSAAFALVYSISGNPYHEYQLLTNGTTTEGFITDVTEDIEPMDAGGYTYYYNYAYTFKLPNGLPIHAYQELSGNSEQEMPDLSEPYLTEIVYLTSNPNVNKLKATLLDSVWEIVWRKIGLGLLLLIMFSSIGFFIIFNAIKEYSIESKKADNKKLVT
jgi:hypothetical protein